MGGVVDAALPLGLTINTSTGQCVVTEVRAMSQADAVGVREGDVLLLVGNADASESLTSLMHQNIQTMQAELARLGLKNAVLFLYRGVENPPLNAEGGYEVSGARDLADFASEADEGRLSSAELEVAGHDGDHVELTLEQTQLMKALRAMGFDGKAAVAVVKSTDDLQVAVGLLLDAAEEPVREEGSQEEGGEENGGLGGCADTELAADGFEFVDAVEASDPDHDQPPNQERPNGIAEGKWDAFLDDLHHMGFEDHDKNLRLLIEQDGNLKKVVRHLVQQEREHSRL